MFELAKLIGDRLNLLHLVVDHLDVFRDFLRGVDGRLNGVSWVVNDPLRACRHGDADCHDRECDEFLPGVPLVICGSLTAARRCQSRESIYHEAKDGRCITRTTC